MTLSTIPLASSKGGKKRTRNATRKKKKKKGNRSKWKKEKNAVSSLYRGRRKELQASIDYLIRKNEKAMRLTEKREKLIW